MTERGGTCPDCSKPKSTKYVALLPITRKGKTIQPHRYAVCTGCYRKQFAVKYGKKVKCPV